MGILLSLVRRRPVVFSVAFLLLARFYLRLKRDRKKFLGFPKKGVSRILSSGQPVAKVKSLWIFPVKSCKPVKMERVRLTNNGFEYDRLAMIVNKRGVPVTQRMIPELARVEIRILQEESKIRIISPVSLKSRWNYIDIDLQPPKNLPSVTFDLHGIASKCVDLGDEMADWICQMIASLRGRECSGYRLVQICPGSSRNVYNSAARLLMDDARPHDGTLLSDLAPLSLTSADSLRKLNCILAAESQVPMDRFRSNIVMECCGTNMKDLGFIEDWFERIEIGNVKLRIIGPTFRCVIPTVDQATGEAGFRKNIRNAEPIKTLKSVRSGGLRFGKFVTLESKVWNYCMITAS